MAVFAAYEQLSQVHAELDTLDASAVDNARAVAGAERPDFFTVPASSTRLSAAHFTTWLGFTLLACIATYLSCLAATAHTGAAPPEVQSGTEPSAIGRASTSSPVSVDVANFLRLYETSRPYCSNASINRVLRRNDSINTAGDRAGIERRWSVSPRLYSDRSTTQQTPDFCRSPAALAQSLKYGRRMCEYGDSGLMEDCRSDVGSWPNITGSYFAPAHCSPHFYSLDIACAVLERYSYVLLYGNSLLRHVIQGLFILLTGDMQSGGLPRFSVQRDLWDMCRCDGQFSEHRTCRLYAGANMFAMPVDPRSYGVCSGHHDFRVRYLYHQPLLDDAFFYPTNTSVPGLCDEPEDLRPVFVVVQGGVHFSVNATRAVSRWFRPLLTQLEYLQQHCSQSVPVTLHVVVLGMEAQARKLDGAYPRQSRELTALFNAELQPFLRSANVRLVLDFHNLTSYAATSDGFHYLTEVNVLKANYLLNLMELVAGSTPTTLTLPTKHLQQ